MGKIQNMYTGCTSVLNDVFVCLIVLQADYLSILFDLQQSDF